MSSGRGNPQTLVGEEISLTAQFSTAAPSSKWALDFDSRLPPSGADGEAQADQTLFLSRHLTRPPRSPDVRTKLHLEPLPPVKVSAFHHLYLVFRRRMQIASVAPFHYQPAKLECKGRQEA